MPPDDKEGAQGRGPRHCDCRNHCKGGLLAEEGSSKSPCAPALGFGEKLCSTSLERVTGIQSRITCGSVCLLIPLHSLSHLFSQSPKSRVRDFVMNPGDPAEKKGHIGSCWRQSIPDNYYTKERNFNFNLSTYKWKC